MDWRSWSAADFSAVTFLMLKRMYADQPAELRELYELVGDKTAVAAIDRETMNQSPQIETTHG